MAITTIGTHGIGTDVIVAADIAANAVTASELADDAVDTAAIANDAVTYVKLQNLGTANRVLGSASTGLIGEVQIATAMIADNAVDGAKIALASQAAGDIMYYNGTDWIRLAKGTADQVLTMNDGATAAGWEAASAGAALTGSTDNTVVTVTGADAMQGEASLTFDNAALTFNRSHDGNNAINLINDSNTSSASTRLTIQCAGASAGDAVALFHAGGDSYIIGVDNSDSNKFKIAATGSNLGTNDLFVLNPSGAVKTLTLHGGAGNTTNHHMLIFETSNGSHGLTTLPNSGAGYANNDITTNTIGTLGMQWYANQYGFAMKAFTNYSTPFVLETWMKTQWTSQASNQGAAITLMIKRHDGSNGADSIDSNANLLRIAGSDSGFIFRNDGTGYADSSWTTYSDNRLKFNQEVVPYGLDTIMQLQPKVYDKYSGGIEDGAITLSDTSRRDIGFIAQEIKALIPEIIPSNIDENNGWYALDEGKLMSIVVKAIQELKAEVDALKG